MLVESVEGMFESVEAGWPWVPNWKSGLVARSPTGFLQLMRFGLKVQQGFPQCHSCLGNIDWVGPILGKHHPQVTELSAPGYGTRSNANWAPGMLTRSWFRSVRATEGGGGFLLCNLHCSLLLHGYIQSATFDQVAKSAEVTFQHYKLLDVQDSSVHSTKDTTKSNEMWQLAWQDLTETNLKQSFEMTPWETPFMLKNTDFFAPCPFCSSLISAGWRNVGKVWLSLCWQFF